MPPIACGVTRPPPPPLLVPPLVVNDPAERPELKAFLALVKNPLILSPTPDQKPVHFAGSVTVKNVTAFSPVLSTHAGTFSVQNSPTPSQKAVQCSGSVLVKKTFVLPRA